MSSRRSWSRPSPERNRPSWRSRAPSNAVTTCCASSSGRTSRPPAVLQRFDETDHIHGLVIPGRHRRWRARNPYRSARGCGFRARCIRSRVYPRSALYDAHIGNSRCAVAPRNETEYDSNFETAQLARARSFGFLAAHFCRLSLRRLRLPEISQIRRSLVLLGGHQEPIPTQEIRVRSDDHIVVALGTRNSSPVRIVIGIAPIRLIDAPRLRQRVVEYGDFLMKEVRVALVDVKALLEGRLVVEVQRQPGCVVGARPFEGAQCFDFKHVVDAVAVFVDPPADRI